MRRVVGARRPNLCASLACEKRHNSQAMSVDRHPDRIASTQRGVCAGGAVTLRGVTASAGYHSCHGYFSGVSLTPWRAHMGTSGAPDPCDDMPAREAGRPVTGIERYKAIAVRAGHPAIWAEGLAGPMGRSTHRDARRWPDEQRCLDQKRRREDFYEIDYEILYTTRVQHGCRRFDPGLRWYEANKHRTQPSCNSLHKFLQLVAR